SDIADPGRFVLTRVFRTTVDATHPNPGDAWTLVVDTPGSVDKDSAGNSTFFGLYRPASGQGDTQGAIFTDPNSSYVYFSGDIQVATGSNSSIHASNWVGRIFQLASNQDYTDQIDNDQARGDQLVSDGAQPAPIVTDSTAALVTGGGHLSA